MVTLLAATNPVSMKSQIDQSEANAGGDIVGGDKNTSLNVVLSTPSLVENLLNKLREQVESDQQIQETIDSLGRYYAKRSYDGINGLEAKLEAGGLSHTYLDAIEQKERFARLLAKWSMYSTAQQIFAHFLAKTETVFRSIILPQVPEKTESEINALIIEQIVNPIVEECGSEVFVLDYDLVFGMVYWLAEQCYVRWHK